MRTFFSWIGRHDLAAVKQNQPEIEPGPLLPPDDRRWKMAPIPEGLSGRRN